MTRMSNMYILVSDIINQDVRGKETEALNV